MLISYLFYFKKRAQRLRKETGDPSYQTEEERQNDTLPQALRTSLVRPFALYMVYIYGLIYLLRSTSLLCGPILSGTTSPRALEG